MEEKNKIKADYEYLVRSLLDKFDADYVLNWIHDHDNLEPELILEKALQKYTLHSLSVYQRNKKELRRKQLDGGILSMLDIALNAYTEDKRIDLKNDKGDSFFERLTKGNPRDYPRIVKGERFDDGK
ncbi:MAG: hypothetical protein WCE81_01590 [Halobacteriota archaeon]